MPNNLKAAVLRAAFSIDREESGLNRSDVELARHCHFQIDPTPPRDPEKKGKVESGVKYVKRNFFKPRALEDFAEALRHRHADQGPAKTAVLGLQGRQHLPVQPTGFAEDGGQPVDEGSGGSRHRCCPARQAVTDDDRKETVELANLGILDEVLRTDGAWSPSGWTLSLVAVTPSVRPRMSSVPIDIDRMTADERLALIEELWDSLGESPIELSVEQRAELARRSAQIDEDLRLGRPLGRSWEDVKANLLAKTSSP